MHFLKLACTVWVSLALQACVKRAHAVNLQEIPDYLADDLDVWSDTLPSGQFEEDLTFRDVPESEQQQLQRHYDNFKAQRLVAKGAEWGHLPEGFTLATKEQKENLASIIEGYPKVLEIFKNIYKNPKLLWENLDPTTIQEDIQASFLADLATFQNALPARRLRVSFKESQVYFKLMAVSEDDLRRVHQEYPQSQDRDYLVWSYDERSGTAIFYGLLSCPEEVVEAITEGVEHSLEQAGPSVSDPIVRKRKGKGKNPRP